MIENTIYLNGINITKINISIVTAIIPTHTHKHTHTHVVDINVGMRDACVRNNLYARYTITLYNILYIYI